MDNTKELKIANNNNKLFCDAFIEIHFAPPRETITAKDFEKIYVVQKGEESIFVQLTSFTRVEFRNLSSILTMPAMAMESHEWRAYWLNKYPNTKADTEMAVYCYKRKS